MTDGKAWPKPGYRLMHRFRKRQGQAEVVSVDCTTGRVAVKVGDTTYRSLSTVSPPGTRMFTGLQGSKPQ